MPAQNRRLYDRQLKGVKPTAMDYVISDGDGLQLRVHRNNHRRHRRDDQLVEAVLALPKTRPR